MRVLAHLMRHVQQLRLYAKDEQKQLKQAPRLHDAKMNVLDAGDKRKKTAQHETQQNTEKVVRTRTHACTPPNRSEGPTPADNNAPIQGVCHQAPKRPRHGPHSKNIILITTF